ISAVLHAAFIVVLVVASSGGQSRSTAPVAYTVTLVDPTALGTNIPAGGGKAETVRQPAKEENATPVARPAPENKPRPTVQEKKPASSVPPESVKETKTPEPRPELRKTLPTGHVKKPEPTKLAAPSPAEQIALKPEEKKPQPRQEATQAAREPPSPRRQDTEPEASKTQTASSVSPPELAPQSQNMTALQDASEKTADLSAEEREKRISAALERVRKQVQGREGGDGKESGRGNGVDGTGPPTLGGVPGEGGGGLVRGLEFILYTEQVKRRVKDNWIVVEKKPGLAAVVRFGIEADGRVVDVELVQPSGDRAFDESTLRAVRSASPLPPPPSAYLHEFATQKVEVAFGGEGRAE
ncbi:MAG: TonB family protein, partial [Candidatus Binatia bacterium]|nr:TonB family protein [Candidatus Binatia bacterium]